MTGESLPELSSLSSLSLAGSAVADHALAAFNKRAEPFYDINLSRTKISDAGLANIRMLARRVNLSNTRVTASGLRNLKQLSRLEVLTVHEGQLSEKVREELLQSHSRLTIASVPLEPSK